MQCQPILGAKTWHSPYNFSLAKNGREGLHQGLDSTHNINPTLTNSVSSDADERSDSGLETQKETARTCSDFLDLGAPSTLPFRGLGFHLPHSSFATGGVGLDS